MSEASFEDQLCRMCKDHEWQCLKLRIDGENGFPDRTILGPNGSAFFAELKAPGGKLRGRQKWWLDKLKTLGHTAGVYYDLDSIKKDLSQWQTNTQT